MYCITIGVLIYMYTTVVVHQVYSWCTGMYVCYCTSTQCVQLVYWYACILLY